MPKFEKNNQFSFAKRPEFINKKGTPRKLIGAVQFELETLGIKPPTKSEITNMALTCLNLNQKQIKTLIEDEDMPMYVRIILKQMLKDKGFEVIEKILDRGIGKATDKIEMINNNELQTTNIPTIKWAD